MPLVNETSYTLNGFFDFSDVTLREIVRGYNGLPVSIDDRGYAYRVTLSRGASPIESRCFEHITDGLSKLERRFDDDESQD